MPLVEQLYCSQQINVPPKLPTILKQFCKAAIRTQPYDLLKWSSTYFRAMANGEEPPAKLRLEYPPPSTASGLTPGFLKVLLRQFGDYNKMISMDAILRRWDGLCLERKDLDLIILAGRFRYECQVKRFMAIAVGLLTNSLLETMTMICELFTHEPEGGSAMIPVTLFMEIYGYLAGLNCNGSRRASSGQDVSDLVMPNDSGESRSSLQSQTVNESTGSGKLAIEDASLVSSQGTDGNDTLENDDGEEDAKGVGISRDEVEAFEKKQDEDSEGKDCPGTENGECVPTANVERSYENGQGTRMMGTGRRMTKLDSASLKKHPEIPGIGPRLSAEQVANVALWMSECASCQEGMVGPRNIRHFQCPLLSIEKLQP